MLAGVKPADRPSLNLPQKASVAALVRSFAYLAPDGDDDEGGARGRDVDADRSRHEKTREALDAVGISRDEGLGIMRLLLATLHLGNVEFGEAEHASIDLDADDGSAAALREAAALLGVESAAQLADGMCSRRFKAGSDFVTANNSAAQASDVRHALSKQLYSCLFAWLVAHINRSLAYDEAAALSAYGSSAGPHIAYVDIFGFEIFETNSLEQVWNARATKIEVAPYTRPDSPPIRAPTPAPGRAAVHQLRQREAAAPLRRRALRGGAEDVRGRGRPRRAARLLGQPQRRRDDRRLAAGLALDAHRGVRLPEGLRLVVPAEGVQRLPTARRVRRGEDAAHRLPSFKVVTLTLTLTPTLTLTLFR